MTAAVAAAVKRTMLAMLPLRGGGVGAAMAAADVLRRRRAKSPQDGAVAGDPEKSARKVGEKSESLEEK